MRRGDTDMTDLGLDQGLTGDPGITGITEITGKTGKTGKTEITGKTGITGISGITETIEIGIEIENTPDHLADDMYTQPNPLISNFQLPNYQLPHHIQPACQGQLLSA